MTSVPPVIGILGAGKVGTVLARLAVQAGHRVLVAGSGDPHRIALPLSVLAPGAEATWATDVAARADAVVLALPLGRVFSLPRDLLAGTVTLDATNYWWETDGRREDLAAPGVNTSALVAQHLEGARVVKALGHVGYHDLDERGRPAGDPDRRAVALAGDDAEAVGVASALVEAWGFDALPVGGLDVGVALQPGMPAFGAVVGRDDLAALVAGRS